MYFLLNGRENVKGGYGWYVVSIFDRGHGMILKEKRKNAWVKVKAKKVVVLNGEREAFPVDEVVVFGRLHSDTLTVEEAIFKKGIRAFYRWISDRLIVATRSGDQFRFALSVITGVRNVRWDLKRAFYDTGTGHVLAISGLHVGIIFFAVYYLLRLLSPGIIAPLLATLLVWLYAWVVGFIPSVVRAALMLTFFSGGILLARPLKPLNVLAISLAFSLYLKPLWLFSPSLWLSYSAITGLIVLRGRLGAIFGAAAYSLPFALHYFGKYALLYLPLNLLVIPLMGLFMYSQLLALLFPYPFAYSASLFYDILEWVVVKAASLNFPSLRLEIGWVGVGAYVFLLTTLLLALRCLRKPTIS